MLQSVDQLAVERNFKCFHFPVIIKDPIIHIDPASRLNPSAYTQGILHIGLSIQVMIFRLYGYNYGDIKSFIFEPQAHD